jgi:electron transfer flavoprotein alpha subunit
MNKIWVYIDQFKGQALPASWEGIGAAKNLASQLGGGVTALVFGKAVDAVAAEAFQYGADEVLLADDATLDDYRCEPFTALVAKLAGDAKPEVILFFHHHPRRELLPRCYRRTASCRCGRLEVKHGVIATVPSMPANRFKGHLPT